MNCKTRKCGCEDTGLHAPCPPTISCSTQQPCAEVFSEQCIINDIGEMTYGADEDITFKKHENLYTSMQKVMIMLNGGDASAAPVNLRATSITSTTITLKWELQNTGTAVTCYYGVTYPPSSSESLNTGDETCIIDGLTANTDYWFKIESDSEDSVSIKVKTLTA